MGSRRPARDPWWPRRARRANDANGSNNVASAEGAGRANFYGGEIDRSVVRDNLSVDFKILQHPPFTMCPLSAVVNNINDKRCLLAHEIPCIENILEHADFIAINILWKFKDCEEEQCQTRYLQFT